MVKKKKRRKRRKQQKTTIISKEIQQAIVGILFILSAIFILLSFVANGYFLNMLYSYLSRTLGIGMLFLAFILLNMGLMMLKVKHKIAQPDTFLGLILFSSSIVILFKSGTVGHRTFTRLSYLISTPGVFILFIATFLISLTILFNKSIKEIVSIFIPDLSTYKNKDIKKDKKVSKSKIEKEQIQETSHLNSKNKKGFFAKLFNKTKSDKKNNNKTSSDLNEFDKGLLSDDNLDSSLAVSSANLSDKPVGEFADKVIQSIESLNFDKNLLSDKPSEIPQSNNADQNLNLVWTYPPLNLLSSKRMKEPDRGDVRAIAEKIEATLDSFGIRAQIKEVNKGPSVTQYAIELAHGTKVSKVKNLEEDLTVALAVRRGKVRVGPIAGKSYIGIEVPNVAPSIVPLRFMLSIKEMKKNKSKLAVGLGIDVNNKPVIERIDKMPHLLIAGATGSGKSVAINSIICSILFRASPQEVNFILVDPKRVELSIYNDIPHLMSPVIYDPKKVAPTLEWIVDLMEERYIKMAEVGAKSIDTYNSLAGLALMPHVVVVIDELADIMIASRKEVENAIMRLAQKARGAGIHLVIATQRPSVDILTGVIKANIPAKMAFSVTSKTDSRVILDTPGAESLLGYGDMLYIGPTDSKPRRIQGTYVSDEEIRNLVDFIKSQGFKPNYKEELLNIETKDNAQASGSAKSIKLDPLFDQAMKHFYMAQKASSSSLQRALSIGFNRAARIVDEAFKMGLIGPQTKSSKPREIYLDKLKEYLDSKNLL